MTILDYVLKENPNIKRDELLSQIEEERVCPSDFKLKDCGTRYEDGGYRCSLKCKNCWGRGVGIEIVDVSELSFDYKKPIELQANKQGFTLGENKEQIQIIADGLKAATDYNVLTIKESIRAYGRLDNLVMKKVKPRNVEEVQNDNT